jgi:hypothetical protein
VRVVQRLLLVRRRDPHDLDRPRGQVEADGLTRPASPACALARSRADPTTSSARRSEKRWISLRRCDLRDAGQTMSTRWMLASRAKSSATPMP